MIEFEDIQIAYDGKAVIPGLSLAIEAGEFFTLLGPSGCGKTTLLRALSGFVTPNRGRIIIGGRDVTGLAPEQRGVGIVFQNYALFPHLSVFENVAFGLRVARQGNRQIHQAVEDALQRIGVEEHSHKRPDALSGGQQQRVAIARALVVGAKVLLLDEPLSNLDAKLRDGMRTEIRAIQQRLGLTAIYVTHDQQEALAMSDRIAVLNGGKIEQIGRPRDIYHQPATDFVCRFVGETIRLSPALLEAAGHKALADAAAHGAVYARPEDFVVHHRSGEVPRPDADMLSLTGQVSATVFRGARLRVEIAVGDARIECDVAGRLSDLPAGTPVSVSIARQQLYVFSGHSQP